jgi:hypothetical protein
MAISSTFSTSNQYIKYRIECTTNWQDIANNISNVTVKVFFWRTNTGYESFGTGTVYCYIDGTTYSTSVTSSQKITSSGIYLFSKTLNIKHNADGKKNLSTSAYISHSVVTSNSNAASFTLTTIPRTSSVTCNSFYIGDSTTINISRASSSFTHTVKYNYGTLSGTIATKTSETSIGWAPPTTFYGQIPNGTTGYGSVTCETYSGDTLIGTATANFNAYAKEVDCIPDVSATIVDTNASTIALTGDSSKLVKYLSQPKVTINATAKNSAAIRTRRMAWGDGQTSTNTTETFTNGVTSSSLSVSATDSRGFSKVVSYDLSSKWVEYVKLAFSSITLSRPESTSSTANIKVSGNYFNGSFGAIQNEFTLRYRYKPEGGTYTSYIEVPMSDIPRTNDTFDYYATLTGIDHKKPYIFEFVVEDAAMVVSSGERTLEKGEAIFRVGHDYTRTNGRILDDYGTEVVNGLAKYRTGGVNINPDTTIEELVLTDTNTPTGGFWYIRTVFYSNKTTTSNKTQIAYPYGSTGRAGIFTRTYVNGTGWSEWRGIGMANASGESVGNASVGELSIEWGKITITPVANTPTTQVVYFGKAYKQPPVVLVTASTGVIGTGVLGAAVAGVATNYATLVVTRTNTVPTGIHFVVIGKVV